jgi:branched-chain amino acid transport system ATP-binding protein
MLEVRGLHSGYGRVPVLRGIDLDVRPGEVLLVLGSNGAGKTTLLRTLAGFLTPTQGTIRLDGHDIAGMQPNRVAQLGLRLVLEGHRVFPELSVADNVRLGRIIGHKAAGFEGRVEQVLTMFPMLRQKYRQQARDLSGGQQQMLALAQAFVARPAVLLCDEPSLGLAQALIPPILEFLRSWAANGTGIVIVEQQIELALGYADRAVVLEQGEVRLRGSAAELSRDPRVTQIYLGLAGETVAPPATGGSA